MWMGFEACHSCQKFSQESLNHILFHTFFTCMYKATPSLLMKIRVQIFICVVWWIHEVVRLQVYGHENVCTLCSTVLPAALPESCISGVCAMSFAMLDEARCSYGTDEDAILIYSKSWT